MTACIGTPGVHALPAPRGTRGVEPLDADVAEVRVKFPEAIAAWSLEVERTRFKIHTDILFAEALGAGWVWEDGEWKIL